MVAAAKDGYRKFKIKNVEGPNDYASMYEVLIQKTREGQPARVGAAGSDLNRWREGPAKYSSAGNKSELGIIDKVDLASIAKGREEGESDKIYIYGRKNPIMFSKNSEALFLLMRIRDEAHRFAITFHKKT